MQVRITTFLWRRHGAFHLMPLCGGLFDWTVSSQNPTKLREHAVERLRKELRELERTELVRALAVPGRRLERVHLELSLKGEGEKRKVSGFFPVVIEPRYAGTADPIQIAYHPFHANEWFELDPLQALSPQIERAYAETLELDSDAVEVLSEVHDKLNTLSFNAEVKSIFSLLRTQEPRQRAEAGSSGDLQQLLRVAVNMTARAADGRLAVGLERPRLRERMKQLLCGREKSPVLVIGPPGSGKSMVIARLVSDLLEADDFAAHRNLDRVHTVWRLQGRHIIAGMSYVGQWEARCVALLERARHRMLFWVDDLYAWNHIGKSTASDRTLIDFFRGPVARRELVMIAECTPEQAALLERDSPGFAASFARVYVEPTDAAQTLAILLHEMRRLETEHEIAFDPRCLQSIIDLSSSLLSGVEFPGKALEPLKALALRARENDEPTERAQDAKSERLIEPSSVIELFSNQTGLPEILLSSEKPLNRAELRRALAGQIMGQDAALDAACDLIVSIRARATARGRPYGVFLFTGPTGTGKTELAKCIAEYLYGDSRRLVRFDMGEFNTSDAPERLIGSQYAPDGQLTRSVRAQPFCVLLLDEIEKAHPSVLNLMLQLFDEGRLTDANGFVADFTHAVIIMTSNLGSASKRAVGFGSDVTAVRADVARAVREFFPPELFNRIDRIVPFDPLDVQSAEAVARKELARVATRSGIAERNIFVRTTDSVVRAVTDLGYSPEYGARSLKRYIDKNIGDLIARTIVSERAAEMRLFYLYLDTANQPAIYAEVLREAEALSLGPSEELLADDVHELARRIPDALSFLRSPETAAKLHRLSARLSASLERFRAGERSTSDHVYSLDDLRAHVQRLAERLQELVESDLKLEELEREHKRRSEQAVVGTDYEALAEPFEPKYDRVVLASYSGDEFRVRRSVRQRSWLPHSKQLLSDLAETQFLRRALERAEDVDEHSIIIELVRLGVLSEQQRFTSGGGGLLEWLAESYVGARGKLETCAVQFESGEVELARAQTKMSDWLSRRPRAIALHIVGPSVRSFFQGEEGCHVRRTASGSEIVRLRVLPARDPMLHFERQAEAANAFQQALESGGELPENPDALLPLLRVFRFAPNEGRPAPAFVEDYRLGYVAERRVTHLRDLLRELWHLSATAQSASSSSPEREQLS